MALVAAVCPNCGGKINVDDTKENGVCESCGTSFITEKVIHQNVTNNNFAGATVNMSLSVDSQKQFANAMQMAMDAYNADNKEECNSFCNQALSVDPKSANAKALKGAAVLLSFSLAGAESDAVEAIKIWQTITDASGMTDEYKNLIVESAFSFRENWLAAAKAHYKEFKDVEGTEAEFNHVKKCYGLFLENVATLKFIETQLTDYTITLLKEGKEPEEFTYIDDLVASANDENLKKFMDFAFSGLKAYNEKAKDAPAFYIVKFAGDMIARNSSRNDEIGKKAREMSSMFDAAKKAHTKKLIIGWGITIGIILILIIKCSAN